MKAFEKGFERDVASRTVMKRTGILLVVLLAVLLPAVRPTPASAAPDGPAVTSKDEPVSFMTLLRKGGPLMIPIGICSVLAVAIGLERLISLRREKLVPPGFMDGLRAALDPGQPDVSKGTAYCEQGGAAGRIIRAGVLKLRKDIRAVERAVETAAEREVERMKRSLRWLSVIARVSPLLGLLGTVYGMIRAFQAASAEIGANRAETLATGIWEALVTTAAGLTIAIPTLLVYHYLNNRVDRFVDSVEELGSEFVDQYATERTAS
ncbi:MAG: MotA/TolQ/ExbB proton channel family protein [Kiritimatiellae bacterium]|nr:MotA/TolQ/ExbB proton channel family protein [Kiritimatiellia bacterium]